MLKKIYKILIVSISIFILFLGILLGYFLVNARMILVSELKKKLGAEVSISDLRVAWPDALIIENFSISKTFLVKKIEVVPSLFGFLQGDIVFNSILIEEPQGIVTRLPGGTFDFGVSLVKKEKKAAKEKNISEGQKSPRSSKEPRFYFNKLKIKDGKIDFIDKATPSGDIFEATCAQVNLDISHPFLSNLSRFQFDGHCILTAKNGAGAGTMKASGWIDVLARDMDGKILAEGLSMSFFYPYYKKYITREIKSGDMVVSADVKSKANDLTADCHLEVANVAFKEVPESTEGTETTPTKNDFTALAFGSFFNTGGSSVFDFSVHTKFDHPKFEKIKLKGSFLQSKISSFLSQPSGKTTEDFKEISKQFKSIGKEFKKAFKSE